MFIPEPNLGLDWISLLCFLGSFSEEWSLHIYLAN